jgi:hypothetical protein
VDYSLAPIRDDQGLTIIGCMVIFRDNRTHLEGSRPFRHEATFPVADHGVRGHRHNGHSASALHEDEVEALPASASQRFAAIRRLNERVADSGRTGTRTETTGGRNLVPEVHPSRWGRVNVFLPCYRALPEMG